MDIADSRMRGGAHSLNDIAQQLRELRSSAGSPSYANLALAIAQLRRDRGVPPDEARISRSTVYDCFSPGRRRIDVDLVADIVLALGADPVEAERWSQMCRDALPADTRTTLAPTQIGSEVADAEVPTVIGRPLAVLIMVCSVAANILGDRVAHLMHLPLFLDMIGTAFSAIVLGPWSGVAVGGLTNIGEIPGDGLTTVPFALVNMAGALVWGYGVRRLRLGATFPRFFVLNVLTALVCSMVAVPILVIGFNGPVGEWQISFANSFSRIGGGLAAQLTSTDVISSLADKMISGFLVLVAIESFPRRLGLGVGLIPSRPGPRAGQ